MIKKIDEVNQVPAEKQSAEKLFSKIKFHLHDDLPSFEKDDFEKYTEEQQKVDDLLVIVNRLLHGIKKDLKNRFDYIGTDAKNEKNERKKGKKNKIV